MENLTGLYSNLDNVSFQAHSGEILGIAGLDGSGRTETLETIFGVAAKKSGTIHLHGREVKNHSARESVSNGFALLTEERRATGIFGILNIRDNTTISSLKKYLHGGFLSNNEMKKSTDWSIDAMRIKPPVNLQKSALFPVVTNKRLFWAAGF